jgi:hypothetical protein
MMEVDVVVAKSPPKAVEERLPEELVHAEALMGGGGNFKQESTFTGDRGGVVEDEELLAFLRGLSSKSSSVDRFANDGNEPSSLTEDEPVAARSSP